MKLILKIDPATPETQVVVTASEIDDDVRAIQAIASKRHTNRLVGTRNQEAIPLDFRTVSAVFTKDKSVYARTPSGDWRVKARLYEVENLLPHDQFVRISQSEIVNISAIDRLDLSISATISVHLKDGSRFFVARRHLKNFKTAFGL
ncbi:MAG: LytTR family DNA-binding domain-containing protein [Actinomycetaceae bacterium]|nr:LytTR family transcriptional regulator DNA-binding domain-containing protein [Arcanobacterium sp.]MDD7464685.1 LytTR family DNA-binding domain-containing protein [Actinomycetaceae bacterium]MDD7505061.1 LytTR family DNA-binding domain-containing protein [Actinomycetaceae bacterium]